MPRYRITININQQFGVLILSDDPITTIMEACTKGGVLQNCTRDFIPNSSVPFRELNSVITIPEAQAKNLTIEIDEVPVMDVNPDAVDEVAEAKKLGANPPLTKA